MKYRLSLANLCWVLVIAAVPIALVLVEITDSQQVADRIAAQQAGQTIKDPVHVIVQVSFFWRTLLVMWCFAVLALLADIRDRLRRDNADH